MNKEMAGVGGELQPQLQRSYRLQDFATPGVIMRERSFVRPQSHHNMHHHPFPVAGKRRSMIMTNAKGKPTLEIYRPPGIRSDGSPAAAAAGAAAASNGQPAGSAGQPAAGSGQPGTAAAPAHNKLNVHAKEFTMSKPSEMHTPRAAMAMGYGGGGGGAALQHSRSSAVLHSGQALPQHFRPLQPMQPLQLPLVTSASTSSIMHMGSPRVHFKMPHQSLTPEKKRSPTHNGNGKTPIRAQALGPGGGMGPGAVGLKRSKSMTTTDALASGMAGLGLSADAGDLGTFPPEVQDCIDKALQDPNSVCSRTLMEACGHLVSRAVESVRYALPAARRCIAVVEREHTETFLESLLNTCQQWYHDRDKLLNQVTNGGRPRLMAFLSFLLEMYCQVRRRAIQRRGPPGPAGACQQSACQPALLLLTLICKCCEDCIRQPVPSAGDTENLFFVLTYIGRDLETRLPGELERLLAGVRDAFLNLGTSAHPSIRKTLLQLIELHASRWNLPGCAVLYYYPSTK